MLTFALSHHMCTQESFIVLVAAWSLGRKTAQESQHSQE